ncbi:MAG: sensor histidine kinase [Alphaproteobacteria bacterium]
MTTVPQISLAQKRNQKSGDVLLGEDWVLPASMAESSLRDGRKRRSSVLVNHSPLARKIIIFNLMALVILVAGVLMMNPFRDSLVQQRENGMVREVQLIANVFEAGFPAVVPIQPLDKATMDQRLHTMKLNPGAELFVFDANGGLVGSVVGSEPLASSRVERPTIITDFLNVIWGGISGVLTGGSSNKVKVSGIELAQHLFDKARVGETVKHIAQGADGGAQFSIATPIVIGGEVQGVVAFTSAEGEIDRLVRVEREQVLQMFVIALLVSIGLSLLLASTIANPLSDLAAAAEIGGGRDGQARNAGRIRIPDLTARPDEIGRLSIAMRGMVTALYDRIDANEEFAADVSHEFKNPLASLRSAVFSMRFVKKPEQREKLLDVIEHDVRRLDRLVSDISNASRLDSELVKEEEEQFNLLKTLSNLTEYLRQQTREKNVEFITDFPADPIRINGLEARLAQVFVNLIINAISFCEPGDAVRVWARKRENRVLIVVEDTGPGIPEAALSKVFKRFYSERPQADFGNHSGLGLAISKQIVEAHGGVIWAENIRPTLADVTSEPLGARFVVGLPV